MKIYERERERERKKERERGGGQEILLAEVRLCFVYA
jgi:hypothetical protein